MEVKQLVINFKNGS